MIGSLLGDSNLLLLIILALDVSTLVGTIEVVKINPEKN